ncbi:hypothetical protein KP509_16G016500 [Ceratopteris richardii]|uniref:Uncharacterized protein n=1 Tax=Ceratopteris richardii TaxID=49495 RepID=A0A8T2SYZ7_CERRI|nr:hypothetical protein KP509_16G016500 [Ceratopteris richardii]
MPYIDQLLLLRGRSHAAQICEISCTCSHCMCSSMELHRPRDKQESAFFCMRTQRSKWVDGLSFSNAGLHKSTQKLTCMFCCCFFISSISLLLFLSFPPLLLRLLLLCERVIADAKQERLVLQSSQ